MRCAPPGSSSSIATLSCGRPSLGRISRSPNRSCIGTSRSHFSRRTGGGFGGAEQEMKLRQLLREDRERGFDLREAPLLRVFFLQLTDYDLGMLSSPIIISCWMDGRRTRSIAICASSIMPRAREAPISPSAGPALPGLHRLPRHPRPRQGRDVLAAISRGVDRADAAACGDRLAPIDGIGASALASGASPCPKRPRNGCWRWRAAAR